MGGVITREMHLLVEWNGWDREINDFPNCGQNISGEKTIGRQLSLQERRRRSGQCDQIFQYTRDPIDAPYASVNTSREEVT